MLAENITGLTSIKNTLANNLIGLPIYGILRKYHGGKYEYLKDTTLAKWEIVRHSAETQTKE